MFVGEAGLLWLVGWGCFVEVVSRHARDVGVICRVFQIPVKFFLVTPKVREAEELLGLTWDQILALNSRSPSSSS
ncbi:hypothetical protein DF220_11190 [Salinibacterium hongtaonis]|uniref:Uncharacterized protein n=1 Tax=Homoserinimonas hongtaonis TaxID=2079791 RepID=A0A2U1SWG8_9MICO|nr:hypothetical protein C2138_02420 [Salinibacterium hongtaonis]AWB88943.1 hypothetical protein C2138_04745 [Salinibacterium hongtaonis]PWB95967.1 hypothetical protein DF220_13455 [Salinibacterium hongtaonis]PWB98334.1 hypothetical protein DF220_11190 [Salinibacterium hongtaonis]